MNALHIEPNDFLQHKIVAYYSGFHKGWNNTEVGYINTLKNDDGTFNNLKKDFGYTLSGAQNKLYETFNSDLPVIAKNHLKKLTICVVPRSKCNNKYQPTQLLFIDTVRSFLSDNLNTFHDGTNYINRIADTPTTHTTHDYKSVKIGITKNTCNISSEVNGKDILLINDTPANYIKCKRLEKATELLIVSDERITNIAFDCGFNDLANFTKSFHDKYNITPTNYRLVKKVK